MNWILMKLSCGVYIRMCYFDKNILFNFNVLKYFIVYVFWLFKLLFLKNNFFGIEINIYICKNY